MTLYLYLIFIKAYNCLFHLFPGDDSGVAYFLCLAHIKFYKNMIAVMQIINFLDILLIISFLLGEKTVITIFFRMLFYTNEVSIDRNSREPAPHSVFCLQRRASVRTRSKNSDFPEQ